MYSFHLFYLTQYCRNCKSDYYVFASKNHLFLTSSVPIWISSCFIECSSSFFSILTSKSCSVLLAFWLLSSGQTALRPCWHRRLRDAQFLLCLLLLADWQTQWMYDSPQHNRKKETVPFPHKFVFLRLFLLPRQWYHHSIADETKGLWVLLDPDFSPYPTRASLTVLTT